MPGRRAALLNNNLEMLYNVLRALVAKEALACLLVHRQVHVPDFLNPQRLVWRPSVRPRAAVFWGGVTFVTILFGRHTLHVHSERMQILVV